MQRKQDTLWKSLSRSLYALCMREVHFGVNLIFIFCCCLILGQAGKTWLHQYPAVAGPIGLGAQSGFSAQLLQSAKPSLEPLTHRPSRHSHSDSAQ